MLICGFRLSVLHIWSFYHKFTPQKIFWTSICVRGSSSDLNSTRFVDCDRRFFPWKTRENDIICFTEQLQILSMNNLLCVSPPTCSSLSSVTPRLPCLPLQASTLHQEKQGFMDSILNTTLRFGKLQEETKVSSFLLVVVASETMRQKGGCIYICGNHSKAKYLIWKIEFN